MTMSLFDDDFYSTRVTRRSGTASKLPVSYRPGSKLKVAVVSSVVSSLVVVGLFVVLNGGSGKQPEAKPALTGGQALVETSEQTISASDKVSPGVVSIINLTQQALDQQQAEKPNLQEGQLPDNASLGSGVIFKKADGKAYIITNAHVIQDAAEVSAVLVNGDKKIAKIVGVDTITDLAVLEVDGKGIDTVVEIGDSDKLRRGEMVIAIGNPLGLGDSLTQGIVSSTHRIIPVSLNQDGINDWEQEVIQTDAAINQGNSGGALVDLNGKLVGINSMKVADMGVEGIGFAIPINNVMPIINQLMDKGKIARPYMGVYTMDLNVYLDGQQAGVDGENPPVDGGSNADSGTNADGSTNADVPMPIIPDEVTEGIIVLESVGPSLDAGIKFNDIIVALDDKPIQSTMDLRKYLYNSKKIGESVKVTYYRDGKKQTVNVKLAEKVKEPVDGR
jgi:serine protease Do